MRKNIKTGLIIICVSLLMVAIKSDVAVANFTSTCIIGGLNYNGVLSARCLNLEGQLVDTGIDLGRYIGSNEDGILVWQREGRFHDQCTQRRLIPDTRRNRNITENITVLEASCPTTNPPPERAVSQLNLDEHIFNLDSILRYIPGGPE